MLPLHMKIHLLLCIFFFLAGCKSSEPAPNPLARIVVVNQPDQTMNELKLQSYGPLGLEWEMMAPKAA